MRSKDEGMEKRPEKSIDVNMFCLTFTPNSCHCLFVCCWIPVGREAKKRSVNRQTDQREIRNKTVGKERQRKGPCGFKENKTIGADQIESNSSRFARQQKHDCDFKQHDIRECDSSQTMTETESSREREKGTNRLWMTFR